MHRVPRTLRHHVSLNSSPRQRQVPNQIQHLVPHVLIVKPQRPVLRPLRSQDDRVLCARPANQAHVAQLLLVRLVPKRPRRRNELPIRLCRQIHARALPPNRRWKLNRVLDAVSRSRINPDELLPLAHLNRLEYANRLAPASLRTNPHVEERLHIRQRAPVQDRQLQVVHFDDHVVHAHANQCREQMFGRLYQHALPHQARRVAHFRHVPPVGRNLKVVQIRPPENDPRSRRRGQHPHRHRSAGVQPHP